MRGVIARVWFGVWLGCVTVAAAQLPPEIQVDRFLLRAERLIEAKDPKGALETMGKIVALQKEHGLILPEAFHFTYAKAALSAGLVQDAIDAVNQYLLEAGREGEFYREALELLEEAETVQAETEKIQATADEYLAKIDRLMEAKDHEAALDAMGMVLYLHREHNFTLPDGFRSKYEQVSRFTQHSCTGQQVEAECWKTLDSHSDCHVWNPSVVSENETVTWSAECSGGLAEGTGTLTWNWSWDSIRDGQSFTYEATGQLLNGKKHGQWIERYPDEVVGEGSYAEGERQGPWVFRAKDGTVTEGAYLNGIQHGEWVEYHGTGGIVEEHLQGERGATGSGRTCIEEGVYVSGKRVGNWVRRCKFSDGWGRDELPYVEGRWHGQVVFRMSDGDVNEVQYVEGKRHGPYVWRGADGTVTEGTYVAGEKHGRWVWRYKDGRVESRAYENDRCLDCD